ncbi:hypothetical protein [Mycobacterium sp.]|uniref:hypothetical protein n=1 Tax=Mycobacterium sp. TaxID=1785 RepID=UPI002D109355|nr:hypothetical protein [Mycobacterium sp.]HME46642.1 hypothetical protein [Mycobacterium sp.]
MNINDTLMWGAGGTSAEGPINQSARRLTSSTGPKPQTGVAASTTVRSRTGTIADAKERRHPTVPIA